MQTVGDRIDLICEALDISRRKFAERIEEKPSTIASIVRGSSPSANIICSIVNNLPDLNERWLLMGEGEMWKSDMNIIEDAEYDRLKQQLEHKNETIDALKGQVSALEKMVELLEKQLDLIENQFDLKKKAS
jgi:transcriptional regulator with XRE-family HTH domain